MADRPKVRLDAEVADAVRETADHEGVSAAALTQALVELGIHDAKRVAQALPRAREIDVERRRR